MEPRLHTAAMMKPCTGHYNNDYAIDKAARSRVKTNVIVVLDSDLHGSAIRLAVFDWHTLFLFSTTRIWAAHFLLTNSYFWKLIVSNLQFDNTNKRPTGISLPIPHPPTLGFSLSLYFHSYSCIIATTFAFDSPYGKLRKVRTGELIRVHFYSWRTG